MASCSVVYGFHISFLCLHSIVEFEKAKSKMSHMAHNLISACMILQIISIASNIFTFKFIKDTFDTSQGLYLILSIDTLTILISVFSGFSIYVSALIPSIHYGKVGCFLLAYFSHLAFYVTPFLTLLISFIR